MFNKKHFDHRLDILELYLTVRDPGTAKAAEAYDGLRKLLIAANKGTQIHLAQLAALHRVASAVDSVGPVLAKLDELMTQMGLVAVDDPDQTHLYQLSGGEGAVLVVDVPAYVSVSSDGHAAIVQQGIAHYETREDAPEPAAEGGSEAIDPSRFEIETGKQSLVDSSSKTYEDDEEGSP